MNLMTFSRDVFDAGKRFAAYEASRKREIIKRNAWELATTGAPIAMVLFAIGWNEGVPMLLCALVVALIVGFVSVCGIMFEPLVEAIEARRLRERYGEAVAAELLKNR